LLLTSVKRNICHYAAYTTLSDMVIGIATCRALLHVLIDHVNTLSFPGLSHRLKAICHNCRRSSLPE